MSRFAFVAACLIGCTHDYIAGDVDPEGASGSATTTGSSASASSESSATDTANSAEGTGVGGSSSSSSSGSNATTTGSNGPQLSALFVPGGLDRIRIFKLEPSLGLCTIVTLVNLGENSTVVDLPLGWDAESSVMSDRPEDCGEPGAPLGETAVAVTITGSASWEGAGIPCELDVAFALELDAAWAPPQDNVTGIDVAVEACP